ncbi:guanine nucleotide-binding protein subunit gamma 3-like [Phalaenopsis equestris]|uniref:guanine nucleotide-binding protein subunit gamma 3-like n=1 Tax=Phalaenopsis equestris TaxID=78828 RepID=UPI0009E41498|nr:guanine nucleotide-binding protein subunit gamma 3-like [Phalaenopsis equestris]
MAAKSPEKLSPIPASVPRPRSPPKYPDICGRLRLQVEAQNLNREIMFLQEELQSLEEAQPVSGCCKEVDEFVQTKADLLLPQKKKKRKSCSFIKSLRSKLCCTFPCSLLLRKPVRCLLHCLNSCKICSGNHDCSGCHFCKKSCTLPGCNFPSLSCPSCSCGCVWYCCPSCKEQRFCCCDKACCSSQCLC